MARRRSYTARANKGKILETAIHNAYVNRANKKREKIKQAQAEEKEKKRALIERERSKKREIIEAEREEARKRRDKARIEKMREKERLLKEKNKRAQKKRQEKINSLTSRASLELEKIGLYPKGNTPRVLAEKAADSKLNESQIKRYLIEDKVDILGRKTSKELLVNHFDEHVIKLKSYKKVHDLLSEVRPQDLKNISHEKCLENLIAEYKDFVLQEEKREKKEERDYKKYRSRKAFIDQCKANHVVFNDKLELLANLAERSNWNKSEIENSIEYAAYVIERKEYLKMIESKLVPFKLKKQA